MTWKSVPLLSEKLRKEVAAEPAGAIPPQRKRLERGRKTLTTKMPLLTDSTMPPT